MRPSWRPAAIWLCVVMAGSCYVAAFYFAVAYRLTDAGAGLTWLAGPVTFYLVGVAVYLRGGDWRLSIRLLGIGGVCGLAGMFGYGVQAASLDGAEDGWLLAGAFGYQLACMVGIVLMSRSMAQLPDTRYRYGYERVAVRATWAVPLLSVLIFLAGPTAYLDHAPFLDGLRPVPSPLPALSWLAEPVAVAYQYYWLVMLVGISLFVVRVVRMEPAERRMLRVVLIVLVVLAAELVLAALAYRWLAEPVPASQLVNGFIGLLQVVAILVAVALVGIRQGVIRVSPTVRRTLVYGMIWTLIAGSYLGLAAAFGLAATARLPVGFAVFATVLATIVLEPVRRRVNHLAERLVFGRRISGYELLVRLGGTLEHAYHAHELADQLAAGLRDGLGLEWAQVRLDDHVATAGVVTAAAAVERPVRHGDIELGALVCGPKLDGGLAPSDLELVETLARQAGLALHHAKQAAELDASRARIVQAQDSERRRIERDLHDGVQQELVALVAKLGLARSMLHRDVERSGDLLGELQGEAVRIVEELRELAHGIHPSVLSDEGLVAAVESSARRMPIPVAVSTSDGLRDARFAIEVEESAFYFVAESLTNVLKHARATRVAINLAATNGSLLVEVRDNGSGLPSAVRTGSGLTNLRDRIEAVGGSLRAGNGTTGGTTLSAELPSAMSN